MTEIDSVKLIPKKPKQVLCHQLANGPLNRVCSLREAMRRQSAQGWSMPSLKPETRTQLETLTSPWSPWFKAIVFTVCLIHLVTLSQKISCQLKESTTCPNASRCSPPSFSNQMNTSSCEKGFRVIGRVVLINFKTIFRISFSTSVSAICASTVHWIHQSLLVTIDKLAIATL